MVPIWFRMPENFSAAAGSWVILKMAAFCYHKWTTIICSPWGTTIHPLIALLSWVVRMEEFVKDELLSFSWIFKLKGTGTRCGWQPDAYGSLGKQWNQETHRQIVITVSIKAIILTKKHYFPTVYNTNSHSACKKWIMFCKWVFLPEAWWKEYSASYGHALYTMH